MTLRPEEFFSSRTVSEREIAAESRLKRIASRARTLAVVYLIVLFLATHTPTIHPAGIPGGDKLIHLLAYFVLTICVLCGWELTIDGLQPKHYFAVWLVGTVYGAFDEITQIPVGRFCDIHDWIADVAGILIGLIVFRMLRWLLYLVVRVEPVGTRT
jgi:VanZ family protein